MATLVVFQSILNRSGAKILVTIGKLSEQFCFKGLLFICDRKVVSCFKNSILPF